MNHTSSFLRNLQQTIKVKRYNHHHYKNIQILRRKLTEHRLEHMTMQIAQAQPDTAKTVLFTGEGSLNCYLMDRIRTHENYAAFLPQLSDRSPKESKLNNIRSTAILKRDSIFRRARL